LAIKKIKAKKAQIDTYLLSTNLYMKLSLFKKIIFGLSKIYLPQDAQPLFNKNNSISDSSSSLMLCNFRNKNLNKFYFNNIKKYKNKIFKKNDFAFFITILFPKKEQQLIRFL